MPGVLGNEYGCSLLERMMYVVQYKNSASLQNVESFVHLKMSVERNACTDLHLLGAHCETAGTCGRADLDRNFALIAKMNELFTFGLSKHIPRRPPSLYDGLALRKSSANAEASQGQQEGA